MAVRIASLYVYPLKSARGIALDVAHVERRGLRHDRRFLVIDRDGRFLTQREHPSLALIDTALGEGELVLEAPDMPALRVPLAPDGPRTSVQIWGDVVEAARVGASFDAWLAHYLHTDARLVFMPDDALRPVDPRWAEPGDHVSFADGFPLLLVGESSLEDLNARLETPVPMDRFRPNVVVRGTRPFEEDEWTRITLGELAVRVGKPCARCTITTIDQRTLAKSAEPLRTLGAYRRDEHKVLFGMNTIADAPGTLRVGDTIASLRSSS